MFGKVVMSSSLIVASSQSEVMFDGVTVAYRCPLSLTVKSFVILVNVAIIFDSVLHAILTDLVGSHDSVDYLVIF